MKAYDPVREFVAFLKTLRRLLPFMQKIQARARQQSCCLRTQKKM